MSKRLFSEGQAVTPKKLGDWENMDGLSGDGPKFGDIVHVRKYHPITELLGVYAFSLHEFHEIELYAQEDFDPVVTSLQLEEDLASIPERATV